MKNRTLFLAAVSLLGLVLILWLLGLMTKQTKLKGESVASVHQSESSPTNGTDAETVASLPASNPSPSNTALEARPAGMPQNRAMTYPSNAFDDWRTPITFYGRVVDETNSPVAGASVSFGWTDTSFDGYSRASNTSDSNGYFTLEGKRGKHLSVNVSKGGYYTSRSNRSSFFYAGENENFVPDPNNPIVFFLRKIGQRVELVTSKNGIRQDLALRLPRDGNPTKLSFLGKKVSENGELTISQIKPSRDLAGQGEWAFSLEIPNGGFIESSEEFPFVAPLEGYQARISLLFKKGELNWTTHLNKSYFITFGEPRKYGWLRVVTDVSQETVFIQYAINPSGSHNLEPK